MCHCKTFADRLQVITVIIAIAIPYSLAFCLVRFPFYTYAFRSLLRVFYALPTVQDTSTRECRLLHHRYNAVADDSWRKCRLLYYRYNAVADGSWRKCRLLYYRYNAVADDSWRNCRLLYHRYNSVTDDSWRKCRLLHHEHNAVVDGSWAGSHLVPRMLHWLLTERAEKVEKGQILWVYTYPTTSSRRRGRHVQSLVEIGSEM
jgi:hypothetical protein